MHLGMENPVGKSLGLAWITFALLVVMYTKHFRGYDNRGLRIQHGDFIGNGRKVT